MLGALLLAIAWGWSPAAAGEVASRLADFLPKVQPGEMIPGADRFGPIEGKPAAATVYRGQTLLGYAFLNADVVNATGYSGKPISIMLGLDTAGVIRGGKLVEHHEPIVLVGIPEAKVRAFIDGYLGMNVLEGAGKTTDRPPVDLISGATVSTIVIGESMVRSALKVARSRGLGGAGVKAPAETVSRRIDPARTAVEDWQSLTGSGAVRHLLLSVGDVNRAFERMGNPEAAARAEPGAAEDVFIDLYLAEVSAPAIGRSLLGDGEYANLTARLKPGQTALLVAAAGRYSFRGTGFVRGGIFDRIQLIQGEDSLLFHDRDYKRLGAVAAIGAPGFDEIGLYLVPTTAPFDPAAPWRLQLLVQRQTGALQRAFLTFDAEYSLPDRYLKIERLAPPPVAVPVTATPSAETTAAEAAAEAAEVPLWQRLWLGRALDIAILAFALFALTALYFFQNLVVVRPRLHRALRLGFLTFTLLWLGWFATAQLSVVNVLTFINSLIGGFSWSTFLLDPLIFVLWFGVAAALILWGRGVFCGWLCPFGALQELLNQIARKFKLPQLAVPWGLHERLWAIKYILFLVLLGLSLHSLALAERAAEIEPFKTAIILHFQRDWPFVAFALLLLVAGLFIERFFCRYLCPLGAALAIPAKLRVFDWLRRHKECGSPCQRCARECPVQAIHPEGNINPNECIQCMNCQVLYWHEHNCPAMIQRRLKREKREALSSPVPPRVP